MPLLVMFHIPTAFSVRALCACSALICALVMYFTRLDSSCSCSACQSCLLSAAVHMRSFIASFSQCFVLQFFEFVHVTPLHFAFFGVRSWFTESMACDTFDVVHFSCSFEVRYCLVFFSGCVDAADVCQPFVFRLRYILFDFIDLVTLSAFLRVRSKCARNFFVIVH